MLVIILHNRLSVKGLKWSDLNFIAETLLPLYSSMERKSRRCQKLFTEPRCVCNIIYDCLPYKLMVRAILIVILCFILCVLCFQDIRFVLKGLHTLRYCWIIHSLQVQRKNSGLRCSWTFFSVELWRLSSSLAVQLCKSPDLRKLRRQFL
jgi:hypothetical protein